MLHTFIKRSRVRAAIVAAIVALAVGALLASIATPASAQVAPPPGPRGAAPAAAPRATGAPINFVYLRNSGDTIGMEVITHSAAAVTGVLSMKGQPRVEWTQALRDGAPGTLTLRVFAPGAATDAAPLQAGTIDIRGDSAYIDFTSSTQRVKQAAGTKAGALPLVNASVLHAVLLASYARQIKQSTVQVFLTSGALTIAGTTAQSGDTTTFKLGTSDMRIVPAPDGMPSVILLPGQAARVVRATGAVSASAGRMSYDAPAGAPYTAEQVRIPTGRGYDLAATLTRPVMSKPVPVVITISGSGPQERDSRISVVPGYQIFRQIADTLGRRGIAVLRFDDRGVGESGGMESARTATSANFADDVRSVVAWLRARPDIDGTRIALAGHSEGGMIAPMVATADTGIRAVALLAGTAYTGRRILMFQNRQAIDQATGLSQKQRDSVWALVPAQLDSAAKTTPWLGYFIQHDPRVTARRLKQPVLVLQGMTDRQVTAEQADSLGVAIRAGGNKDVTVRKFPATNHLFLADTSGQPTGYPNLKDVRVRPEVLGALADFMVRVLK